MLINQVPSSHLALHDAQQQKLLLARQQARLRQASIDFDRLHFHELVAQQLANHRKRPKLLADAHARISQWELDGLCWSGYAVAWKSILALPLPQLMSAILPPQMKRGPRCARTRRFSSRAFKHEAAPFTGRHRASSGDGFKRNSSY